MKIRKIIFAFIASALLASGSAGAASPVEENGWLSVKSQSLVNEKGNPVILKGVSIGWHNLWPRFYNHGAVDQLAGTWGCNVVRAAIGAELEGNFASDPETALNSLYKVADAAIENGIYVIVDWHAHKLRTEEARRFFTAVAERYKGVPNVI